MEYVKIDETFPKLSNCAVTLGKFDGVHRGHRKLVDSILEKKEEGATAVLFAFISSSQAIYTSEERSKLLEKMGVDVLLECPLNEKIRNMRAENFIKEILVGDLQVTHVAVGEDFRFGHKRKGTPELLMEYGKKYGYTVDVVSEEMDGNRKISSTYIREELRHGNMQKVNALLGSDFHVTGIVQHGRGIGHKMLFPTTNLVPGEEKLMPPNGVYVTLSRFGDQVYQGITNVGYKPTVGERFIGVETYLFDCEENLYGQECVVSFYKFLRPEQRFDSFEALKEQMEVDILRGREFFVK